MRAQSAKRRREYVVRRRVLRQLVEERGEMCEARLDVCQGRAVDGHERLSRSAGGSITDPDNIILLCRACHDWVTSHRYEGEALGLRQSRYGGAA